MSSSKTSKTTPSYQANREEKSFTKFGLTVRYGIIHEHRPLWERVLKDAEGNELDPKDTEALTALVNAGSTPRVSWELTDKEHHSTYVEWADFSDTEGAHRNPIFLYSTTDGPILGIQADGDESTENVVLTDPCLVNFAPPGATIQYMPIFNVARHLTLYKSAIRAVGAPAEVLLASYPGFVLQNRMAAFQLKPKVAFSETPELKNDAG